MQQEQQLDVLVVAAHPDDAEISVGGTMLLARRQGARVGVVDLTRGEMGTRGSRDDRDAEAAAATRCLGLVMRENLGLPDGRVEASLEAREALARILRRWRPSIVLAHHEQDLHPDHCAAGRIAREAWYLAGLRRLAELEGAEPAARPKRFFSFLSHVAFEPTVVVDISSVWQEKVELVRCYKSQLEPDGALDRGQHFLFGADILGRIETKARSWGERIGARYGEPLLSLGPLPVSDLGPWLDGPRGTSR